MLRKFFCETKINSYDFTYKNKLLCSDSLVVDLRQFSMHRNTPAFALRIKISWRAPPRVIADPASCSHHRPGSARRQRHNEHLKLVTLLATPPPIAPAFSAFRPHLCSITAEPILAGHRRTSRILLPSQRAPKLRVSLRRSRRRRRRRLRRLRRHGRRRRTIRSTTTGRTGDSDGGRVPVQARPAPLQVGARSAGGAGRRGSPLRKRIRVPWGGPSVRCGHPLL